MQVFIYIDQPTTIVYTKYINHIHKTENNVINMTVWGIGVVTEKHWPFCLETYYVIDKNWVIFTTVIS